MHILRGHPNAGTFKCPGVVGEWASFTDEQIGTEGGERNMGEQPALSTRTAVNRGDHHVDLSLLKAFQPPAPGTIHPFDVPSVNRCDRGRPVHAHTRTLTLDVKSTETVLQIEANADLLRVKRENDGQQKSGERLEDHRLHLVDSLDGRGDAPMVSRSPCEYASAASARRRPTRMQLATRTSTIPDRIALGTTEYHIRSRQ